MVVLSKNKGDDVEFCVGFNNYTTKRKFLEALNEEKCGWRDFHSIDFE